MPSLITSLPDLATAVEDHVTTSIPLDLLPDLIGLAPHVEPGSIRAVGLSGAPYETPQGVPDADAIRSHVAEVLAEPGSIEDGNGTESGEAVCA